MLVSFNGIQSEKRESRKIIFGRNSQLIAYKKIDTKNRKSMKKAINSILHH